TAGPGTGAPGLVTRFADDPAVAPLLLVHGLHPFGVRVRLERALERLEPYLSARGAHAALTGVERGTASVRLQCREPTGSPRLREAIETALLDAAPELTEIGVETVNREVGVPHGPALIQILRRPPKPAARGSKR